MQLHNLLKFKAAWMQASGEEPAVVLASRIRLARNLQGFPFPGRSSARRLKTVRQEAFAAVRRGRDLANAAFLALEELETVDRELLVERRLISHDLAARPEGRGVAVGEREALSVMVNEEDHLRLQGIGPGACLEAVYAAVDRLDTALAERLPFAFHPRWGFLASCPTNTGTGLRASALAHLGAVSYFGRSKPLLQETAARGFVVRGLYGEGTQVLGDLFQFATGAAMGRPEAEYVAALSRFVRSLVDLELRSQRVLAGPAHRARFADQAFRSLGVLTHARLLGYGEMMNHLSLARLGLRCGLPLPVRSGLLDELMVTAQPAHLQYALGHAIKEDEIPAARAEFVRDRLQGRRSRDEG